jgi:hypothetical protein
MSIDCMKDSRTKSQPDYSELQLPELEPDRTPTPTNAPAGSKEKVEVLRKRVEKNEQLWHPNDDKTMVKRC